MRTLGLIACLSLAGCSVAPVAKFLDWVAPGGAQPDLTGPDPVAPGDERLPPIPVDPLTGPAQPVPPSPVAPLERPAAPVPGLDPPAPDPIPGGTSGFTPGSASKLGIPITTGPTR